jgi:hypothetical protein
MSETNPISAMYHQNVTDQIDGFAEWSEPGLKILRLRLISDPGFPTWDVSYCHGQLKTGQHVQVLLPFDRLWKKDKINGQLLDWARQEQLYLKDTGIFSAVSTFCE